MTTTHLERYDHHRRNGEILQKQRCDVSKHELVQHTTYHVDGVRAKWIAPFGQLLVAGDVQISTSMNSSDFRDTETTRASGPSRERT